jgi:2-oxoisovalerate dehydrogenase E1 component
MSITAERIYRSLYLVRRVEEEIARIYPSDKIKSPVHLSIGQEAVAVGVCAPLQEGDTVFGTYRGHGVYLAKGGDLNKMMAELYGKATGCAKGKGGSMHLVDVEHGVMGTSAIVATTIPLALGYAYALKQRGSNSIVVSFFGDGAVEEGVWAESMNLAALKQLPVLFVCENNSYAVHSHISARQATPDICARASAFGVPAISSNGDVFALAATVGELAETMRAGGGPRFIEVATYRWKEHVGPNEDHQYGYRSMAELTAWKERDQVKAVGALLANQVRAGIEADVDAAIEHAIAFAEASPFPNDEELYTDVYAGSSL